jgi:hypothetical protein
MSCIASLPDRYTKAAFSRSYLDLHIALIVPDHMRAQFSGRADVEIDEEVSIALVSSHYFAPRIAQVRPNARIVTLESAEDFFSGDQPPADALLLSAEEGAAYAFRYPRFAVVLPRQSIIIPAAYALPRGEVEWHQVVSNWVDLKRKDGSVDTLREYWLEGGATENKQPRWSVIRNVLGWVD